MKNQKKTLKLPRENEEKTSDPSSNNSKSFFDT